MSIPTSSSLDFYLNYSDSDEHSDRERGAHDARKALGHASEIHCFEGIKQIIKKSNADTAEFSSECDSQSARMQSQLRRLQEYESRGHPIEKQSIFDEYNRKKEGLDRRLGPHSSEYAAEQRDLRDIQAQFDDIAAANGNRPLNVKNRVSYLTIMIILALGEGPLNRLAFDLIFETNPLFSLMIAAALGCGLMFLAHMAGMLLRQRPRKETVMARIGRLAWVLLILIFAGVTIYIITVFRQGVLDNNQNTSNILIDMIRGKGAGTNSIDVIASILSMRLGPQAQGLLGLNVGIFFIGVMLSYARHDPDPSYEPIYRSLEAKKHAVRKLESRYRDELSTLRESRDDDLRKLDKLRIKFGRDLADLEESKSEFDAAVKQRIDAVANVTGRRLAAYRQGYIAATGLRVSDLALDYQPRAIVDDDAAR